MTGIVARRILVLACLYKLLKNLHETVGAQVGLLAQYRIHGAGMADECPTTGALQRCLRVFPGLLFRRLFPVAKAKQAPDTVLAQVYRAQADALLIESRAKMRLAEEYDVAKEAGEVAGHGGARNFKVAGSDLEKPTIADIGLTKQEISEARLVRNAERADPGVTRREGND